MSLMALLLNLPKRALRLAVCSSCTLPVLCASGDVGPTVVLQ